MGRLRERNGVESITDLPRVQSPLLELPSLRGDGA
jgi:hypothetical protein